jgi:hypothetical protein
MLLRIGVLSLCVAGLASGAFRAGAARRVITPDLERHGPVYLAGFANNRVATSIHDDLFVRCVAMAAEGPALVLCGVDSIGLFFEDIRTVRQRVAAAVGTPHVVHVGVTHVHQAPDPMGLWGPKPGVTGVSPDYLRMVLDQITTAAIEALQTLRPATIRMAARKWDGILSFFDDSRPPFVHDEEAVALAVSDQQGQRIATLVNWANHPEALGSKNTLVTADFASFYYQRVEQKAGGVAVFLNGALGGMMSPLGAPVKDPATGQPAAKDSFRFAEVIGHRLADEVLDALERAEPVKVTSIRCGEQLVRLPVKNESYRQAAAIGLFQGRKEFLEDGSVESPVGYAMLLAGRRPVAEIALVPGELYPELSVGGIQRDGNADFPQAPLEAPVKPAMRAPIRMLVGLANDEIGYILPKAQWDEKAPYTFGADKRWYGEVNSLGPDTAPLLLEALEKLRQKVAAQR